MNADDFISDQGFYSDMAIYYLKRKDLVELIKNYEQQVTARR